MEDSKLFAEFAPVPTSKWEEAILRDLKGADYNKKLLWHTLEGFDVRPYYRAEDLKGLEYLDANPGSSPFTRGTRTLNNVWDIRQDILSDDPAEANRLALHCLNHGVTSIGLCAHKVHTPEQMEILLNGIDPTAAKINFLSSSNYLLTLELLANFAHQHGFNPQLIQGSIGFDMFRYALTFGTFHRGQQADLDMAAKLVRYAARHLPQIRCLTIHGSTLHNAGSNIVQELAFTLGAANEMLAQLTDRGCTPSDVCRNLLLELSIGSTYFMEMAKFRAIRLLWSKLTQAYGLHEPNACPPFIHAVTSSWNKTVFDPFVNMLRTTTETMSAAIAGVNSICTQPFDLAYKTPDEFSYRIARNQQILLQEESSFDKTIDPAAGSYYIENLTNSLIQHTWQEFLDIEKQGGLIQALLLGSIQDKVALTAQQRDLAIATRRTSIVGTNQYPNPKEQMAPKVQPQPMCQQGCNSGTEVKPLRTYRGAEAFEELRLATERSPHRPKVFLLTHGDPAMRKARAGFASNFFGCAGYEIINNLGFPSLHHGIQAALDAQPDIVVLCSSDDKYPSMAPPVCQALQGKVASIVLAGNPGPQEHTFRSLGIHHFIHLRTNALECLQSFNNKLIQSR